MHLFGFSSPSQHYIFLWKLKLAQFFENENKISENTCEMFMNDVMEEKCLQEYEIIPNIQIESNQNPMKENIKKIAFSKTIWKLHNINSLCWAFFVWMITKMLMRNAFKPWDVQH